MISNKCIFEILEKKNFQPLDGPPSTDLILLSPSDRGPDGLMNSGVDKRLSSADVVLLEPISEWAGGRECTVFKTVETCFSPDFFLLGFLRAFRVPTGRVVFRQRQRQRSRASSAGEVRLSWKRCPDVRAWLTAAMTGRLFNPIRRRRQPHAANVCAAPRPLQGKHARPRLPYRREQYVRVN